MRVIYVHHAERDISNVKGNPNADRRKDDITENGQIECQLLAEKFKHLNIAAIYTSPYLRCKHTAELINEYSKSPIICDDRLNEIERGESWEHLQLRINKILTEIIEKHAEDDTIVCVSSGVNISGFIFYFTGIKPSNSNPWIQAVSTSPVLFSTNNNCL